VHKVEFVRLSEVVGADRNAKTHSLPEIKASIRRFGFVAPLVRNAATGKLVAGHGRTEALRQLQREKVARPARIEVGPDGEWLVPIIAVPFADKAAEEAYLIADNRLSEIGGIDQTILTDILADLRDADALQGIGYSDKEVDALLKAAAKDAPTLAEGFSDEADATMDALDGEDDDARTLVLTVEADEYQAFVSRLQAVMRACKGASWTDAVKALLDRWEAESDG
jgi:ParB-like chromosome segregation protein Spo0J